AERGRQGGWRRTEGYRTDLTGMKTGEFISLMISAHPNVLQDLGIDGHYDAAYRKLVASSPSAIRENAEMIWKKVHIDGAGWHQPSESCPCLPTVQEAVWAEHRLIIHYKREQEISIRTVEPLGLVSKRSVWYLA